MATPQGELLFFPPSEEYSRFVLGVMTKTVPYLATEFANKIKSKGKNKRNILKAILVWCMCDLEFLGVSVMDSSSRQGLRDEEDGLLGGFLTERSIDFDAMQHLLASLWQPGKGENPRLVDLNEVDLWVQLHDLRSGFRTATVAKDVANYIGKFVESDEKNFLGLWRDFLRVRVTINVTKPLKRRMRLQNTAGIEFWTNFKYEHLPTFCFICGIMGYSDRFCPQRVAMEECQMQSNQPESGHDTKGTPVDQLMSPAILNQIDVIKEKIGGQRPANGEGVNGHNGLYGEPNRNKRKATWDRLRNLAATSNLPWCVMGDLNNVVSHDDKQGGNRYPEFLIQGFQQALAESGLQDMDLCSYPFTWERGRGTESWIEVHLDRGLVNQSWLDMFNAAKLYNLEVSTSDHCPIFMDLTSELMTPSLRRFRFENAWLREPLCIQIVKESWDGSVGSDIQRKVAVCSRQLQNWGKEYTGKFKERIGRWKKEMNRWKSGRDESSIMNFKQAKKNLVETYAQREVFWRQRSKQLWL
uniref:Zinc knuckle CX2CX4HX4C domain-containing protein n=1 Tax=Cannabis sativa TaxID=3483 RepID=A0A803NLX7_CANSA